MISIALDKLKNSISEIQEEIVVYLHNQSEIFGQILKHIQMIRVLNFITLFSLDEMVESPEIKRESNYNSFDDNKHDIHSQIESEK